MQPFNWKTFLLSFDGRVSLRHFWFRFVIPYTALSLAISLSAPYIGVFALYLMGALTVLGVWPSAAVGIKRWHDRGKSGWWCLSMLLPVIGWVYMFLEVACFPGEKRANAFGPATAAS